MAGYRGHISGAFLFFFLYLIGLFFLWPTSVSTTYFVLSNGFISAVVLCATCIMFGLWPDVDTNSKGQDIFYSLFFTLDVVLIFNERFSEAAYLGLFCILPILGKHRGWTHTYWAMLIVPSPILILPLMHSPDAPWAGVPYYGAAVVGYFSHLFLDGLVADTKPKRRRKRRR